MWAGALRVLIVLGLAVLAAIGHSWWHELPWLPTEDDLQSEARRRAGQRETRQLADDMRQRAAIALNELRRHVQNDTAVVIDARLPDAFFRGHLAAPRVLNVTGLVAADPAVLEQLLAVCRLREPVIIYGEDDSDPEILALYAQLRTLGQERLYVFVPGWQGLARAEVPTETGPAAEWLDLTDVPYGPPADDE